MSYRLELTEQDCETIGFVGDRYCWSEALYPYEAGMNDMSEHEAWKIKLAFEEDTLGGHEMFPMLDPHSELYEKLLKFYEEIV